MINSTHILISLNHASSPLPLQQDRRLSTISGLFNPHLMKTIPEFADLPNPARRFEFSHHAPHVDGVNLISEIESENTSNLIKFYNCLPINTKPKFSGSNVSQAPQIEKWLKGEGLAEIQKMDELDLNVKGLTCLPSQIGYFKSLTYLSLENTDITTLPAEIGKLTNLESLFVSNNKLQNLPPEIGKLKRLTKLDISNNKLHNLPPEIENLVNLKTLDLSANHFQSFPFEICSFKELETLELQQNQIHTLPEQIGKLKSLNELDISNNKLHNLPTEIGKLTNLKKLNLYNNLLKSLPEEIGILERLELLAIQNNKLQNLPTQIGRLNKLKVLLISNNQLQNLPHQITNLQNLARLGISGNPLPTPLPDWISLALNRAATNSGIERIDVPIAPSIVDGVFIPPYNIPKALGFENATPPAVVRPVHATAPTFGPYISTLLKHTGATPIETDINFPNIDPTALTVETQEGILKIRQSGRRDASVAVQLLQNADPASLIGQISIIARNAMSNAHGLALPGGPNIEPEFYNNSQPLTKPQDYRRSLGEFALIQAAKDAKKPILGTCRGAQGLNVFSGGTLKDIDEQQIGWQKIQLSKSSKEEQLAKLIEASEFTAYAFHGQACDKIAPGFEVAAHFQGITKLIVSQDGLMIGTQVHPEKANGDKYSSAIRLYQPFFEKMMQQAPISARL